MPTGDELTRVTRLLMQQPLEIWNQKSEMMKIFWKEFAESADEEEEYQYENDTSSKKFFPDGYIDCSGGEPVACFYLKDHLGNGRMVIGRCRII